MLDGRSIIESTDSISSTSGWVAFLALLLIVSMASPAMAAPVQEDNSRTPQAQISYPQSSQTSNYTVHQTLNIEKNGTVTVRLEVTGTEIPNELYLRWVYANAKPTILEGKQYLTATSHESFIWNTSHSVTYQLNLSETTPLFQFPRGFTSKAVWFSQRNLLTVKSSSISTPSAFRVTIHPPEGWNGTAPGKQIDDDTYELPARKNTHYFTPRDIYAVGDFQVYTTERAGTEYRVAHVPSANPPPSPADHLELLASAGTVLGNQIGVDAAYGRFGLVVPDGPAHTGSAQARSHSYVVSETERGNPINLRKGGESIYVHEIAHTYLTFGGPEWISEGAATYLEPYILYKTGYISSEAYKRTLSDMASDYQGAKRILPASNHYEGGAVAIAALDLDIRARTNGKKNVTDFFAKVFDQSYAGYISANESITALKSLTGADYSDFLLNRVHSPSKFTAIARADYTLSDGVKYPSVKSSQSSQYDVTGDGEFGLQDVLKIIMKWRQT